MKLKKYKDQIASARTESAQRAAKQQAIRLLKQKKLYEGQRDQMYAQQMNLESTRFMTEQLKDTADQVAVMKQAQQALAQQMQHVNIDEVDELQEQMQDLWVSTAPLLYITAVSCQTMDLVLHLLLPGTLDSVGGVVQLVLNSGLHSSCSTVHCKENSLCLYSVPQ